MKITMLNSEELSFFCSQFSVILRTGVALHDGVDALKEDMKSVVGKEILKEISKTLYEEKPFYTALENAGVFPEYVIKMVKIGEMTGRLDEVLDNLATYYENDSKLKRNIHDAIMQPLMIVIIMFIVVSALVIKIIPVFVQIFEHFDPVLSESVSQSVNLSTTVGICAMIVLFLLLLGVIVLFVMTTVVRKNERFIRLLGNFPGINKIAYDYAVTRFANAMYLMIKSGVDTATSIEYAIDLNNNKKLEAKLLECKEKLDNFESFAGVITEAAIFNSIYSKMLKIAYKTGVYEDAWGKIKDKYNEKLDDRLSGVVSMIEPVLIATVTIIIGVVLVTVMLPLMSVMGNI